MKNYLFHGSHASGIETLHATSKLHGTEDKMAVFHQTYFAPVWRMALERAEADDK